MKLVEGLCYLYPHMPNLVASHPVMVGVWRKCSSLLGNGAVMAPLLVDDRIHPAALCEQTVEDLIRETTGRDYGSLPWLGEQISEAALEKRHGALGCVALDALYHLEVLGYLAVLDTEWEWVVVHPVDFQGQQAAMLTELWERLASTVNLSVMAERLQENKDLLRARFRESLFKRFCHYWVGEDGRVRAITRPVYAKKGVKHEYLF